MKTVSNCANCASVSIRTMQWSKSHRDRRRSFLDSLVLDSFRAEPKDNNTDGTPIHILILMKNLISILELKIQI